jgi:CBS domain-containing protein
MKIRRAMMADTKSVASDTSIAAALALMRLEGVRHLAVLDGSDFRGVVSNGDYRRLLERTPPDETMPNLADMTVAQIMTPRESLVTARPDVSLALAARLMIGKRIGCLPIMDRFGRLVGLLDQKAVVAALLKALDRVAAQQPNGKEPQAKR